MIRIENKRTYRGAGVYIGRPRLLGNPFESGVHGDREDVIRFYRQWLWDRIMEQGDVYVELKRLAKLAKQGGLTLICWCFPKPCQGLRFLRAEESGDGQSVGLRVYGLRREEQGNPEQRPELAERRQEYSGVLLA
jgi:uncharacterized protein DUF4326